MTPSNRPITVMLVDDHPVVRTGVRALLSTVNGVEVVAESGDGASALRELAKRAVIGGVPDVVVVDLVMPHLNGLAATEQIRHLHPTTGVVVVSSFSEAHRVQEVLAAGASAYVLKESDPVQVIHAVEAVARGDVYLDPVAARVVMEKLVRPSHPALSDRERAVLKLVASGMSNREIAQALGMSERTARTHVSNILSKIGLQSRTQAALWAIKEGFTVP